MKLKEPISPLERIENFCKKLFKSAPAAKENLGTLEDSWVAPPKANIKLTEFGYDLEIDMPGFEKDEIEVDFTSKLNSQVSNHKN